jgi:hypothetical protein
MRSAVLCDPILISAVLMCCAAVFCCAVLCCCPLLPPQVYCYCTQGYMVTFERELISEPDEEDAAARLASTYRSPLSFDDYDKTTKSVDRDHHHHSRRKHGASTGG